MTWRDLQLVLTHRLQLDRCVKSVLGHGLQLVLTHRLQPVFRQSAECILGPSTRAYAQVATDSPAVTPKIIRPSTRAYAQVATFRYNEDEIPLINLQLVLTHRLQRAEGLVYPQFNPPSTRAYAQVATAKLYNKHSPTRINMCSLTLSSVLSCSEKSKSY